MSIEDICAEFVRSEGRRKLMNPEDLKVFEFHEAEFEREMKEIENCRASNYEVSVD